MSKQRILQSVRSIEDQARHIVGGASGTALDGILADCTAIRVLLESDLGPDAAVAMTNPASQSSVQIEQAAKGPPRVTVKVYDIDPGLALERAVNAYDLTVAKYDRTEGLNAAAVEMLEVLETLVSESVGDFVYSIRERVLSDTEFTGESWDHPRVKAWGEASAKAAEIVKRFGLTSSKEA